MGEKLGEKPGSLPMASGLMISMFQGIWAWVESDARDRMKSAVDVAFKGFMLRQFRYLVRLGQGFCQKLDGGIVVYTHFPGGRDAKVAAVMNIFYICSWPSASNRS